LFVWYVSSWDFVEVNDSIASFDVGSSKAGFASSRVLGYEEDIGFDQFRVLRICKEEPNLHSTHNRFASL
jgi:hypothetical protein